VATWASSFSGLLAYAFTQMGGLQGLAAWRWIFIMEGIITCAIALVSFVFLVDFPQQATRAWRFLSEDEVGFVVRRIDRDRHDAATEPFSWERLLRPALDVKVWLFALIQW
jgi:MFS family permease